MFKRYNSCFCFFVDASENAAAWATLQEDIPEELNAHLNVTLEEEEQFLMMYKNLILPHIE